MYWYVVRRKTFSAGRGAAIYRSGFSQIVTVRPSCKIHFIKDAQSESEEGKVDSLSMQRRIK